MTYVESYIVFWVGIMVGMFLASLIYMLTHRMMTTKAYGAYAVVFLLMAFAIRPLINAMVLP